MVFQCHPRRNRRAPLRVVLWVSRYRRLSSVIPVETDGLHCGGAGVDGGCRSAHGSSPSKPTGSIAGRQQSAPLSGGNRGSSPSKPTGSIAGARSLAAAAVPAARHPRRNRRAPLRARRRSLSRLRGLGVIPVETDGLHCGDSGTRSPSNWDGWSSPSKPTGSIAGADSDASGSTQPGHPRRNRRAPLRDLDGSVGCGNVAASSPSKPTGSIAGRSGSGGSTLPERSSPSKPTGSIAGHQVGRKDAAGDQVIPVETDGLHCGRLVNQIVRLSTRSHPRRNRRAPLREVGKSDRASEYAESSPSKPTGSIAGPMAPAELPVTEGGHPRRNRRAPLRGVSVWRSGFVARHVIPVETDGLHCGTITSA